MAVNRDALVSGETLSALLIICLEHGPILETLCLVWVKNRRRQIETDVRHSSLTLSGRVGPWGRGAGDPSSHCSSKVARFIIITPSFCGA